jgi:preprotein translocase subunit SecA
MKLDQTNFSSVLSLFLNFEEFIKLLNMERIVIEVDERLAKAWRRASDKKRKEIGNKFNISLAKELMNPSLDKTDKEYLKFLNELREEMSAKGLTQDELDEILNDE